MKRHLALVGFMASGKSTIGRKLARKLGCAFFDTDALVMRDRGPIAAIFENEGEAAFRRYESAAIDSVLTDGEPGVVALGGGSLTVPENRRLLTDRAWRVFIRVSPQQILARVRRGRQLRPILGAAPTLAQIEELYAARMPDYESADHVVDASRRSDRDVIEEIVAWLARNGIELQAIPR